MTRKPSSLALDGFTADTMLIDGTSVDTHLGDVEQSVLRFFPDNPRIYSIVRENGRVPSQDDIQEQLEEMDHVKALVHDIKKHGGLIDPLVIKGDSLEVVEGNSRLAAYRVLSRRSPAKWSHVKCRVLPSGIDDRLIASLLGQWHLKGKREWPPFEQAGYLYRRHRDQKATLASLGAEAGVPAVRVEKILEAYQLMIDQGDTKRDRWSYYDEFVKSRKIGKVCEAQPEFRTRVLTMVKRGEFERAQDLRDKVPVICDAPAKVRQRFASGKLDLDEAFEAAKDAGGDNAPFQRLRKFRVWIAEQDVQDSLERLDGSLASGVQFELKTLARILNNMVKKQKP